MIKKILITLVIFIILLLVWYFGYYINTPEYLIEKIKKKCPIYLTKDDYLKRLTRNELKIILNSNC